LLASSVTRSLTAETLAARVMLPLTAVSVTDPSPAGEPPAVTPGEATVNPSASTKDTLPSALANDSASTSLAGLVSANTPVVLLTARVAALIAPPACVMPPAAVSLTEPPESTAVARAWVPDAGAAIVTVGAAR
jgi:hypothetical protein